jgi:hypothetical protein
MEEQIKEKSDIEKSIKEESPVENHSEPFGSEGDRIGITAFSPFPSGNCYFALQQAHSFCHLKYTLIIAYTVCNRECNQSFIRWIGHVSKVAKSCD